MSITTFFRNVSLTFIGLLLAGVLVTPTFAETKKLDSVALTVDDLGNPFFVQVAHGAEYEAKHINSKVKFTALSSNYDVNNQTNPVTFSGRQSMCRRDWPIPGFSSGLPA
jgi:ABC-type sugar transport system substrate-binding protein